MGKIVSEVLSTLPRPVVKTEGTVFTNTDQPTLVNNIFTFCRKKTRPRSCDKPKKENPPEFAGKIEKFRPLLEPIRLNDSCLFEIAPFSWTKLDKYTIFILAMYLTYSPLFIIPSKTFHDLQIMT